MTGAPRVLLVDNYDSFTYNLADALARHGAKVRVLRNDDSDVLAEARRCQAIVLSPGPGHPATRRDVGACRDLVRQRVPKPMLGVCLGLQVQAQASGGRVVRAPRPVHGEAALVSLGADPLFQGLPRRIRAGRYHSFVADEASLPAEWRVIARGDGLVMGVAHRELPWWGVQFHPESILTPHGERILANFLKLAGSRRRARTRR